MMRSVLVALLLLTAPLSAAPWSDAVGHLDKTVLRLNGADRQDSWSCSAVVVAGGLALTAAHCVDGSNVDITIGGRAATVVKSNRLLDLAVVKFLIKDEVPVTLALKSPSMGAEIAVVGFALGKKDLHAQFGHIANSKDEDGYLVLDLDVFHGDSGTIVLNKAGQLVGLISARQDDGSALAGLAVPVETVVDFIKGL